MRIVILGASGQIGGRLYKRLVDIMQDAEIIGTSRNKKAGLLQFDPFKDDWSQLGKLDVLINCIGIIKETHEDTFNGTHISLAEKILYHDTLIGSPRIIQLSALGADVHAASAFLSTKAYADDMLLRLDRTLIIRPSIVCTPGTMLVRKLKLLQRIMKYSFGFVILSRRIAGTRIQPVMVDDVLDVFCKAIEMPDLSSILELGGHDIYTVEELIHFAVPSAKTVKVPDALFRITLRVARAMSPNLLDKEMLLLLSQDNTTDSDAVKQTLQRPLASTRTFFIEQL